MSASRNGLWLAIGHAAGGTVALWAPLNDAFTEWREVSRATLGGDGPVDVAFSPTDDTLAVACGNQLKLLRLDLEELARLHEPGAATAPSPQSDGITRMTLEQADAGRWRFVVAGGAGRQDLYLNTLAPQDPPDPEPLLALLHLRAGAIELRASAVLSEGWSSLRDRLVPDGLADLPAMAARQEPLVLVLPDRFAHVPWECLLGNPDRPRPLLRQGAAAPPQPAARTPGQALLLELSSGWRSRAERVAAARVLDRLHDELPAGRLPQRPSAREALETLLSDDPTVLVLAGVPDPWGDGLQLGDGALLGPREIQAMRRLPELLLVACGGHPRLAAALGRLGLGACVAPLWAVDEAGATTFCTTLLEALRAGQALAQAVNLARTRTSAQHPGSTTWMAYAVWGDPGFRLPALATPAETLTLDPATNLVRLQGPQGEELIVGADTAAELTARPRGQGNRSPWWKALEVLQGTADPGAPTLEELARAVDERVPLGLLPLTPAGTADPPARPGVVGAATGAKLLVLIPGLMGDAGEVFAPLWQTEPSRWARLFERYRGQVYAFQPATLLDHPATSATALLNALPPHTELDLVTHFSAGLVGEVLAQAWGNSLALDGAPSGVHPALLAAVARDKGLRMVREVRLGAPMRGMPLNAQRLDMLLALLLMRLPKAQQQAPALKAFNLAAMRQREALATLPGLAALAGDAPVHQWLARPTQPVPGDLRLIAGVARPGVANFLLGLMLPGLSRDGAHDGLVPQASALAHAPRSRRVLARVLDEPGLESGALLADPRAVQAVYDALAETRPEGFTLVPPAPSTER